MLTLTRGCILCIGSGLHWLRNLFFDTYFRLIQHIHYNIFKSSFLCRYFKATYRNWKRKCAPTSKNVPLDMCAQRRLRSACKYAHSDQVFTVRFLHSHRYKSFSMRTTKILIRLSGFATWPILARRTCQYVFSTSRLQCFLTRIANNLNLSIQNIWQAQFGIPSDVKKIAPTMNVWNEHIQSNLVFSNSLISNYRLSRSENLVPVLTWNYDNR